MTQIKLGKSIIFVDFAQAFGEVKRNKLRTLLRKVARNEGLVTKHYVELMINLLEG